jgi:hypothetical protein
MEFLSIVIWLIDRVGALVSFILTLLVLGTLVWIVAKGLHLPEKSTLSPTLNFWKRAILATFQVMLVAVLLAFLFLVLLMGFLLSGSTFSITGIVLGGAVGGIGAAIFESETNVIIMFAVFGLIILAAIGYVMKEAYKVSFGWALLTFALAGLAYIGLDYLAVALGSAGGLGGLFSTVGQALEVWLLGLAVPGTTG